MPWRLGDLTPSNFNGDATGFKLGQDGGAHVLNRVLAWGNNNGIDINGNGTGVIVNNSVGFDNNRNWYFDETAAQTVNLHVLKNNISFDGNSSDTFYSGVVHSFNTWNWHTPSTQPTSCHLTMPSPADHGIPMAACRSATSSDWRPTAI